MTDWTREPAHAIAAAVKTGAATARLVAERHLAAIERRNGELKAFTAVTAARALTQADAIDAARARGDRLPPLAGVPYAVKNLFDIAVWSRLRARKSTAATRRPPMMQPS